MILFDDLKFDIIDNGYLVGKGCRVHFTNGYGASIVSHNHSYGGEEGLYEIAVLNKNGDLIYDTPITNDVIGHLQEKEVEEILISIQKLPNRDE